MITPHELELARRAAASLMPSAPAPCRPNKDRKLPPNVYPHGQRFRAQLTVAGKIVTIGTYRTPGEAATAVATWKAQQPLKH